jgi:hypothetical protein
VSTQDPVTLALVAAELEAAALLPNTFSPWYAMWLSLRTHFFLWRDGHVTDIAPAVTKLRHLVGLPCTMEPLIASCLLHAAIAAVSIATDAPAQAAAHADRCTVALESLLQSIKGAEYGPIVPAADLCAYVHQRLGATELLARDVAVLKVCLRRLPMAAPLLARYGVGPAAKGMPPPAGFAKPGAAPVSPSARSPPPATVTNSWASFPGVAAVAAEYRATALSPTVAAAANLPPPAELNSFPLLSALAPCQLPDAGEPAGPPREPPPPPC